MIEGLRELMPLIAGAPLSSTGIDVLRIIIFKIKEIYNMDPLLPSIKINLPSDLGAACNM